MSEGEDVEIIGDDNAETDEDLSIELNKLKVMHAVAHIRFLPQGIVDNILGRPYRLAGPNALYPNHCRQTIPLIAQPSSGSPNCA